MEGRLYVSANQWPRRWYHRALENPRVGVTVDCVRGAYYEKDYELEFV